MKHKLSTLFLVLILLAGVSLLLYPTVSDYWNSFHASQAVASYSADVQNLDQARYDELWSAARDYNQSLLKRENGYFLTDEQRAQYDSLLDITGTGIMGYIEIPTGGESTHCVLSGHRGLPSAKLFTNLDQLVEGDTFVIRVLDEVLTYEVDRILIVEPDDVSALQIEPGKDLCTLVTCTPYGINSHRLLVRGHRVENQSEAIRVTSDAIQIEPLLVAPAVALPILLILLIVLLASGGKKKPKGGKRNANA